MIKLSMAGGKVTATRKDGTSVTLIFGSNVEDLGKWVLGLLCEDARHPTAGPEPLPKSPGTLTKLLGPGWDDLQDERYPVEDEEGLFYSWESCDRCPCCGRYATNCRCEEFGDGVFDPLDDFAQDWRETDPEGLEALDRDLNDIFSIMGLPPRGY